MSHSGGSSSPGLVRCTGRASGEQSTLVPGPGRSPWIWEREEADQALGVRAARPRLTLPAGLSEPGGAAGLQSCGEAGPAPEPAFGRNQTNTFSAAGRLRRARRHRLDRGGYSRTGSGGTSGRPRSAPALQKPNRTVEAPRERGRSGSKSRIRAVVLPLTLALQSLEDEPSIGFVANKLGVHLCRRNFRSLVPRSQYLELPTQWASVY